MSARDPAPALAVAVRRFLAAAVTLALLLGGIDRAAALAAPDGMPTVTIAGVVITLCTTDMAGPKGLSGSGHGKADQRQCGQCAAQAAGVLPPDWPAPAAVCASARSVETPAPMPAAPRVGDRPAAYRPRGPPTA